VLKELADFNFAAIPHLNRQRVLDLAHGGYLHDAANILLVGAPGWAKPTLPLLGSRRLSPRPSRALLHRRRSEQ